MGGAAWRLFVAVPVPDGVRATLADILEPVRRRVRGGRWQAPETWHLTVRFLGDTPLAALPAIETAVRRTAASRGPFPVELGEAGAFERRRGGRVAWVSLARGEAELAALAAGLAALLAPGQAAQEPFRVHLTIAREAPDELVAAVAAAIAAARQRDRSGAHVSVGLGARPVPPAWGVLAWTADRLVLYRSVLGSAGATHTPLLDVPLTG